ncbi:M23 family metallopeptidase [Alkaliphilus serpentinus]|uniref:Peptidoglycan DD-metalloendopeptidase family protein n=1 Tax=Alkaliphilus serpentinus TaxID=1482731 RepID=A0A833HQT4_9FIRM|nr:M23 family metallopeptidase [Alkaliphilus serpentinus]KAB3532185.1 peptidoglycan DD-metalloendopeptidase family protein [Alkaliphilus serpentinus]
MKDRVMVFKQKANKWGKVLISRHRTIYTAGLNKIRGIEFFSSFKNDRKKQILGFTSIALLVGMIGAVFMMISTLDDSLAAFEVVVDQEVLAIVRDEADFQKALEAAEEQIQVYDVDIPFVEKIQFNEVDADDEMLTNHDSIVRNILMKVDIKVSAVALLVDGKELLRLPDMETANKLLDTIKEPYHVEGNNQVSIQYKEKVELREIVGAAGSVRTLESALNYILIGTDEEKIHEVQKGESAWGIAKKYEISVEDIAKANPDINPDRLQIGQEISLIVPKPYISVVTREYAELVEGVPFETNYEDNETLYEGDSKILVQGVEGIREVKAYIIKENGVEVGRDVLEEEILSDPKTRVIAKGTKPRPKTMATGIFSNPTRGRLTSGFGMRWGVRHQGIDVAAPTGTSITAADGGLVTFSGRNGGYGNLVIIDHENGYQTYYAHNNSLLVKKGERVYKGQKIATVGSTGNSTGPHVHFEVRKNGVPVNPLRFVSY